METEYTPNDEKKKRKNVDLQKYFGKPIDDIFREVLPCPARQNDFNHLPMDNTLKHWDEERPPEPTWLNHYIYRDIEEHNNNNNNNGNTNSSAPKQEKILTDPWIGDALMLYHFLFQFKDLLRMNDKFTMSEWIDCIRKRHATYLMNFVLATFVQIIMDKQELKAKDKDELFNGYRCSLLTWPSLLKDFLNIRKRLMLVADRVEENAFNDIIDAIDAGRPETDMTSPLSSPEELSTPFFTDIPPERKIELLVIMMRHIVQETKLFKHFFQTIANEADEARKKYLNERADECKRVKDEAKSEDKVMRGLHRSMPVHWADYDIICKSEARDEKMPKTFMDMFYTKFFHSMSLEGANKGKVTKEDKERYE